MQEPLPSDARQRRLLMLIDGHNILFRAFSSVPKSITDAESRPVNGVYGMVGTILKLIRDRHPEYVAVAFDIPAVPTFRHLLFPAYQGQRGPLGGADAENFAWQIEAAKLVLEQIGVRWRVSPGYEADDILATLAEVASRDGVNTIVVTTDRDLQQLVREDITVLIPGKVPLELNVADVEARLGIPPHHVADWKILAGDPSDNIPGVAGIGDKSAVDLVRRYGSWREVYDHLDKVSPRQRKALDNGRRDAELFSQVVALHRDLTLDMSLDELRVDASRLPNRAGDALREAGLRPEESNA